MSLFARTTERRQACSQILQKKNFTPEKNYFSRKEACLAVVLSVRLLCPFWNEDRFTLCTDHRRSSRLLSLAGSPKRVARWRLRLAELSYEAGYRTGTSPVIGDGVSYLRKSERERSHC